VFEPFFSTKDGDENVGLGLTMTSGIVRNHAGIISLKSARGGGTTFTVRLPVSA
jgi:signal transduction histidine kinase